MLHLFALRHGHIHREKAMRFGLDWTRSIGRRVNRQASLWMSGGDGTRQEAFAGALIALLCQRFVSRVQPPGDAHDRPLAIPFCQFRKRFRSEARLYVGVRQWI